MPAQYARLLRPAGPCCSVFVTGEVILCGGIVTTDAFNGIAWCVLSKHAAPHLLALHRAVTRFLGMQRLRRIEASVLSGFAPGIRWVELLGFEHEGSMRGYGPAGETYERYAKVNI